MKHVRPSYLTVKDTAHPLVKLLFAEMERQQITLSTLAVKSGIARETISRWRVSGTMTLISIESCLQVVGLSIIAVDNPLTTGRLTAELAKVKADRALLIERIVTVRKALEAPLV